MLCKNISGKNYKSATKIWKKFQPRWYAADLNAKIAIFGETHAVSSDFSDKSFVHLKRENHTLYHHQQSYPKTGCDFCFVRIASLRGNVPLVANNNWILYSVVQNQAVFQKFSMLKRGFRQKSAFFGRKFSNFAKQNWYKWWNRHY